MRKKKPTTKHYIVRNFQTIFPFSTVGAGDARDATASLSKIFLGQNCLDLGKFGKIMAKLRRNLAKIVAKFGQNQNLAS